MYGNGTGNGKTPLQAYNMAQESDSLRAEFHCRYPGGYLGVTNSEQCARCPGTPPTFGMLDRGDFYAFQIAGSATYHVVPRFGRACGPERRSDPGWSHLFDCRGGRGGGRRRTVLLQPACCEVVGGAWTLKHKGILLAL
jgi:hypothetical protein